MNNVTIRYNISTHGMVLMYIVNLVIGYNNSSQLGHA